MTPEQTESSSPADYASAERYRLLFQVATDALFVETLEGRILECNAAACEMYGYTHEELVGLTVADIVPEEIAARLPDIITQEMTTGGVFVEALGKKKDGQIFPTEVSTRLVTLDGELRVLVSVRDITRHRRAEQELREAEARYRTLVEQIPAIIYIDAPDAVSSAIYMSPHTEAMLGYSPEEWVADPEFWLKLLHPDDRERVLAENTRTNLTGEPFCIEYRLIARDGRVVWVRDVAVLVKDEAGQPRYWQGVMLDITDRKRAEEELRTQKQLLENLVAVARATAECPTLKETLQNALNVTATLTGAAYGDLILLDENGAVTHSLLFYGDMSPKHQQDIITHVMDKGLAGWVARHRQAALIQDTLEDDRWLILPDVPAARSALSVPILSGATLVGVLTLFHPQPHHFDTGHLHLLQAAADQMALAMRNAQIFEAQTRQALRQTTLYQVLSAISGPFAPEAMARGAVEAIVRFTGWPHVSIAMLEEDQQHWAIRAASGPLSPPPGLLHPLDRGIIGRAFRTGQKQIVPEVKADADYMPAHPQVCSELVIPLRRGEQILGVLNLESDRPAAFDTEDILLAESLADAIALALENSRLFQATLNERSRLQAIIESSRDGIILFGKDSRILVINTSALQLLGLPYRPQDWMGRSLVEALYRLRHYAPTAMRGALAEMRRVQRGDEPPGEGEYAVPPRIIYWLNLPVLTHDTSVGRLLVLRDVTAERALEQWREDMTHTLVHDMRNPLGTIFTALEILSEDLPLAPAHHQALHIARRSTQKLLGLVNSILDVNRLESGQLLLECSPVQLRFCTARSSERLPTRRMRRFPRPR